MVATPNWLSNRFPLESGFSVTPDMVLVTLSAMSHQCFSTLRLGGTFTSGSAGAFGLLVYGRQRSHIRHMHAELEYRETDL